MPILDFWVLGAPMTNDFCRVDVVVVPSAFVVVTSILTMPVTGLGGKPPPVKIVPVGVTQNNGMP